MAKILGTTTEGAIMKVPKSVTEASIAARTSTDVIRRAVDRGDLKAVRMTTGERLIDPDDLERWLLARNRRAGTPNDSSTSAAPSR